MSTLVACRPDLLDQFVDRSRQLFADVRSINAELSAAWASAATACPGVAAPPTSELLGLHSAGLVADHRTQATATDFRRAGIHGLLTAWSIPARATYWLERLTGERVPRGRPDWKLIRFGTSDRGRLIEVRGDLASANRIVVLVPGMTNELSNVERSLRPRSQHLYDELVARARPGESVAVVMWLGYRNPALSDAHRAVGSTMAAAGAETLVSDLTALRGAGAKAHITVVAHSYGTVLAGEAMDRSLPADRLVVLGSPGMNAASRSQLGSAGVELFASSVGSQPSAFSGFLRSVAHFGTGGNPVATISVDVATGRDWAAATTRVGLHGADPAAPGFGAHTFLSTGTGHDAYFEPRSLGLANVALISLGREPVAKLTAAGPARRPVPTLAPAQIRQRKPGRR